MQTPLDMLRQWESIRAGNPMSTQGMYNNDTNSLFGNKPIPQGDTLRPGAAGDVIGMADPMADVNFLDDPRDMPTPNLIQQTDPLTAGRHAGQTPDKQLWKDVANAVPAEQATPTVSSVASMLPGIGGLIGTGLSLASGIAGAFGKNEMDKYRADELNEAFAMNRQNREAILQQSPEANRRMKAAAINAQGSQAMNQALNAAANSGLGAANGNIDASRMGAAAGQVAAQTQGAIAQGYDAMAQQQAQQNSQLQRNSDAHAQYTNYEALLGLNKGPAGNFLGHLASTLMPMAGAGANTLSTINNLATRKYTAEG